MSRAAVEPARNVFPGIDAMYTFDLQRLFFTNPFYASVRMRRPQDLDMQHALHYNVRCVSCLSRNDRFAERICEASSDALSRTVRFHSRHPKDRVFDRPITCATAEIPLEHLRKLF